MCSEGHNRTLKRRSCSDDKQRSVSQQPVPPDAGRMRSEQVLLLCLCQDTLPWCCGQANRAQASLQWREETGGGDDLSTPAADPGGLCCPPLTADRGEPFALAMCVHRG